MNSLLRPVVLSPDELAAGGALIVAIVGPVKFNS
jgi:hypothetical protein